MLARPVESKQHGWLDDDGEAKEGEHEQEGQQRARRSVQ